MSPNAAHAEVPAAELTSLTCLFVEASVCYVAALSLHCHLLMLLSAAVAAAAAAAAVGVDYLCCLLDWVASSAAAVGAALQLWVTWLGVPAAGCTND